MKNRYGKNAAAAVGLLLMGASTVQAANYINAAGGKWEVPANWDTGVVPSGGVTVTIAGSAGGQTVDMDTNSWNYIIASNLQHNATTYRTAKVLLGGTATTVMNVDIGAGNTWQATSTGGYYVGDAFGSDGTLNILSGTVNFEASRMHIAQSAGSKGLIHVAGADATYIAGREAGGISLTVGTAGEGLFYLTDGIFRSRAGVEVASSGTFQVAGSAVDEIGVGTHNSLNGSWLQASNGVLKAGIDSGGFTPILIDDLATDGPDGFVTAEFEDGSLLEPYFIDGIQTGKWTVMTVDGSIADSGLTLDNGGDTNWSFNVVSNYILEVWYGLGDSGYEPAPPPAITYTNALCVWDGEFGDSDWDNPTNWAFASNMVLPLQGTGSSGAIVEINTNVNYPVYTLEYGSRDYQRLYIANSGDGRFDVLGSGYQLRFDNGGTHYCGENGNTGVLYLDGGATLKTQASLFNLGRDSGSTGLVTVVNNSRWIVGRESSGVSLRVGSLGGHGEVRMVNDSRFLTRAGVILAEDSGSTGLFSVQGAGGQVGVGLEGSVDGSWTQHDGGTLQALVTSNGLTTIQIADKTDDGLFGGDVYFHTGALLDVDFTGFDGENGSWDVMTWGGSLVTSNLTFAPGVDESTWSMSYVDTDNTNGVDTLRITAYVGPSIDPNITAYSYNGSEISLSWDSELGVSYNVLSKPDLISSIWSTNVAAVPGAGATTTSTNVVPSGGSEEFFIIEAY